MRSQLVCPHLDRPLRSMRHLADLLGTGRVALEDLAEHAGGYYSRSFDMRREQGKGKWRHIDSPDTTLKQIQRKIHAKLLRPIVFPPEYCGGIAGRSTKDNAAGHVGQPLVVCMDLKNCFPSISNQKVFSAVKDTFRASDKVAGVLTKLTTYERRLPQGAPSSPMLANLVLFPMYAEISELAARLECGTSYYVDDITVSGPNAARAIDGIVATARRHGFALSARKKRVLPAHVQQSITGIVVNRKLSMSRAVREAIRYRIVELSNSCTVQERELRSIWGQIGNVTAVNPEQGQLLEQFAIHRLPQHGDDGPKTESREWRPCKCYRRDHSGAS
jgi:RNA-directed DNA polymerase